MLAVPGVTTVACGDQTIHWLAPNVGLTDDELRAVVHPDEWAQAAGMKAKTRRAEFLRSRWLLRRLTGYTGPLPRTDFAGPSWPPGLLGSLTHKDGYVGLALRPKGELAAVGIDLEDLARVKPEFEARVCGRGEGALLAQLAGRDGRSRSDWLGVIFSFKEALFKCHHPLGGKMFYFHDAELLSVETTDPGAGHVTAEVLLATSPLTPKGHISRGSFRWHDVDGRRFVLTSVTLPLPR